MLEINGGPTENLLSDHLVSDRIIHFLQRPNHSIEPRKLHPSSEMEHITWRRCIPHRRVVRGQERKLGINVAFLDDAHHRKPRVERLCRMLRTVAGDVNPPVVSECLHDAFDRGCSVRDGLEFHVKRHVGLVVYPLYFVFNLWEMTHVRVCT